MNVIPCVSWVKRGIAAAIPEKVQLTAKELENIIKQTQAELKNDESDSENEETEEAVAKFVSKEKSKQVGKKSLTDPIVSDEYNFDHYDEETDNVHCHIRNIAVFGEDGKDPLVTKDESEEDSEKEDDIIKHDDNLILVGHVEDDASILEVYVYNEREGSLYCHHDMLLPSFPLCIEWLNFDIADSKPGNLCAIGNMTPIIEIWDLDLMDGLEPAYKLGRKPSKKKKQKRIGHRDAVLDLAWNLNYTHILASGSVDQTILLWDLENTSPVTKLDSFEEKVQSLQWHPTETHQLLTGCADKMVRLFDCKVENNLKTWQTSGEVERVLWNHFDNNYCFASTDNGYIEYFDVRNDKPLWQINAHAKEVTGLCLSSTCAGLLVSSSNDGVIKVWDITDPKELVLVWEKKTNLGAVQCLSSNPDNPFVFAMGGDNRAHNFQVMDFSQNSEVHDRFKNNVVSSFDKAENEKKVEMMEVTEDMSSMDLNTAVPLIEKVKKKKKKKCDD